MERRQWIYLLISLSIAFLLSIATASAAKLNFGTYDQWYEIDSNNLNLNHQGFFRRARFFIGGHLNSIWSFKIEYDFALNGNFKNVWLRFKQFPNVIRVGQFKVPWNPIYYQNSRFNWFNEWPLPVIAFNPNFRRGVSYHFMPSQWNIAVSVFSTGTQTGRRIEKPVGNTVRILYIPWQKTGELMQVGLSNWYQRTLPNRQIRFSTIPEARGYIAVKTINTGTINNVNYFDAIGAEWLFELQRFAAQAGLIDTIVPRQQGTTLHFIGWYSECSYFLTPTLLDYNRYHGAFSQPNNIKNAWQLVLRISQLSLNSHEIQGGDETNASFGINFYFAKHIKLGFNYIYAVVKNSINTTNNHSSIVLANAQFIL